MAGSYTRCAASESDSISVGDWLRVASMRGFLVRVGKLDVVLLSWCWPALYQRPVHSVQVDAVQNPGLWTGTASGSFPPRFWAVYTKLLVFNLTQYERGTGLRDEHALSWAMEGLHAFKEHG